MKKLIASIAALAVITSTAAVSAFAEENTAPENTAPEAQTETENENENENQDTPAPASSFSAAAAASSATVAQGTTFTVSVNVDMTEVNYWDLDLVYNADVFQCIGAEGSEGVIANPGAPVNANWSNTENVSKSYTAFTATFAVKEDAAPGTYSILLTMPNSPANAQGGAFTSLTTGVEVTVAEAGETNNSQTPSSSVTDSSSSTAPSSSTASSSSTGSAASSSSSAATSSAASANKDANPKTGTAALIGASGVLVLGALTVARKRK